MAGNLRQIQLQAKSIKNIQKLTNSMKMVAATRFKQAERLLMAARPLGVGARKFYDLVSQEIEAKSKIHYLVPFTSDRGLCGACHFKTCKATTTRMKDGKREYRVICVGEKAKLIISFKVARVITLVVNGIGHKNPTFKGASQIAVRVLNSEGFQEGTLFYSHFATAMSYDIKQVKVYSAEILRRSKFVEQYETDSNEEVDMYVEFSLAALIFYAMTETYGVELFSRMNAMAAASKNAGSLHSKLSQAFNRARQNMITRDLIDIVSGASVVSVKKKPKSRVVIPGTSSPPGMPPSHGSASGMPPSHGGLPGITPSDSPSGLTPYGGSITPSPASTAGVLLPSGSGSKTDCSDDCALKPPSCPNEVPKVEPKQTAKNPDGGKDEC